MNIMKKAIGKRRTLVFLDFEGTGISHEMIAFGAVKVELDKNYQIKKIYKGIKTYVLAKNPITSVVTKLTGITEEMLKEKGIPYKDAIEMIKKYVGKRHLDDTCYMYFGSHDCRILCKSLENSPDADEQMVKLMTHRSIDVSLLLSTFVRDSQNNPLSLLHYMEVFGVEQVGTPHDPLTDAMHLMYLYKGFMNNSDVLYNEYIKILPKKKEFPEPIREMVAKLLDGQNVTPDEFQDSIKKYIG